MAWLLKNVIFTRYFSAYDERVDIGKRNDPEGRNRGVVRRYNEIMGEDYDTYMAPLLDNLVSNTRQPQTILEKFLRYAEYMMGLDFIISPNAAIRRKFIQYATRIHQKKGTRKGYEIAFGLIGYQVIDLVEHNGEFGFDSPITFDHPTRRFDQKCYGCTDYTLSLSGNSLPDAQLVNIMLKILQLVEPINANLRALVVNGVNVAELCDDGTVRIYADCDYVVPEYVE